MVTKARVTITIFWLGFLSFLATSVPHVAWLYRQYEPSHMVIWDVLSYAIAISIDVLIAWLSFVQTEVSKKKSAMITTWLFIAALCAISYYANYIYDMAHNPTLSVDVWSIHLFDSSITVASCTPLIVSALPVFVIAYTFMLNVVSNTKSETLEEKATRLEKERAAKERIREASKGTVTNVLKGVISSVTEVVSYAASNVQQVSLLSTGETTQPAIASETSLESQETPLVKWNDDNTVHSVQFPDKDAVIIHDHKETPATLSDVPTSLSHVDTESLVAIASTPASSETVTQLPRYVPRSKRTS